MVEQIDRQMSATRFLLLIAYIYATTLLGCDSDAKRAKQKPKTSENSSPFIFEKSKLQAKKSATSIARIDTKFTEIHQLANVDSTYLNGDRGDKLMVTATGGGAAWCDFDGDQVWDLYLNQGGNPVDVPGETRPNDKLFRNQENGRFQEVTDAARVTDTFYGQGVSVGDYDDDGFDDLYITNVGRNTLFHNQGDGTFTDVTATANVSEVGWSSSSAWSDVDGDGDLDLYVCNYCRYDPANPIRCGKDGVPAICHPKDVPPAPDELFINQGDGSFSPQARQRGTFGEFNRALGVVIADFDKDGDRDIYVANDTTANFLFVNDGTGHFREMGTVAGCAVDRNGSPQASMGVACGDYDGDGFLDLYSTHYHAESNTLYRNIDGHVFEDVTGIVGLHSPTMDFLGFGTFMLDFNLDGRQELFVANGHIERVSILGKMVHEMTPQHFTFNGPRWQETTGDAGPYFKAKYVGRGVAMADFDNDGDGDLCVVHQNAPAAILRNDSERGHWLSLRMQGRIANRRGINSRVVIEQGGRKSYQELCGGMSYASGHQPILTFGLGEWEQPCNIEVIWANGKKQILNNVQVDQTLVVTEEF